jgi:hypothetical protein
MFKESGVVIFHSVDFWVMTPCSLVAAPLAWHSVAAVLWDTWESVLFCSRTMLSVRLPWRSILILLHSFWSLHWLCCQVVCSVPWCCVGTFPMLYINVKLQCNIVPIPSSYLLSWLYCSTSAFTETRHTTAPSALLQQHHKQVSFVHTFHWNPLGLSAMLWEVKQYLYRPVQVLTFPGGWGSQISRQLAHEGGKFSTTH